MENEIVTTKKHNILYRVFTSTKTSIILFGCLLFFFLVGSVLPYHGDYSNITVKGFLFNVIKALDLLNVYSGPWFLTVAALFLTNIFVCSYHRLRGIIRGYRPQTLSINSISAHRNAIRLSLSVPVDDTVNKLHHFFRSRLFRRIPVKTRDENTIGGLYEKGILHPMWLSLTYHFSVVLILVGCVITFLFAFEGEVTIFDDKPVEIATISDTTTWHKLFGSKGESYVVPNDKKFEIGLKKFETKYTHRPRVKNFPMKGFSQRTKEIVKEGSLTLYSKEDSYYPIEYSSQLVINDPHTTSLPLKGGGGGKDVFIKVNLPLRYRGITFYQSAYDYRFDLLANGEKVEISKEDKFNLPGIDGEFKKGEIISGKFVGRDGSISSIQPFIKVSYTTPDKDASKEEFKILEGVEQETKGIKVKVENLRAGTVLSYRYDPGLKPLWVGAPILFFAMLFRAWGRWYRVSYVISRSHAQRGNEINLYLHIHRTGIWGNEERILRKLKNAFGFS